MKARADSELLKHLNGRAAWNLPEYRVPMFDPQKVEAAVRAYASANLSDPFAARRMSLYLKQGYELPSDILADSNKVLADRARRKNGQ